MIRPGLTRISALLRDVSMPWRAVHVAGTNGKGSICAYLSALFHMTNIKCGRFTSPHLIDRWDCITIDERPIDERIFREVESSVLAKNEKQRIGASEFELLTATAFEIFSREEVEVAVVECGLGGRLDATNVIERPTVTVISKIGLDHQALLGNTLKQIAFEKAGIMKANVTCIVDGTSEPEALDELYRVATEKKVALVETLTLDSMDHFMPVEGMLDLPDAQLMNVSCAISAFPYALQQLGRESLGTPFTKYLPDMLERRPKGRFQTIDLSKFLGRQCRATLDGAHNAQAWTELLKSLRQLRWRSDDKRFTWVIAASEGKDTKDMFKDLPSTDNVILTQFGPVDGMPWVKAMRPDAIMPWRAGDTRSITIIEPDVEKAIRKGAALAATKHTELMIAGSLYLVSDVLRLLRDYEDAE